MTTFITCLATVAFLVIVSFVLGGIIAKELDRSDSINLVGGKLENSDASIKEAVMNLKITNEWSIK